MTIHECVFCKKSKLLFVQLTEGDGLLIIFLLRLMTQEKSISLLCVRPEQHHQNVLFALPVKELILYKK